uniref:Uncharacterized protein n=1 Tax=Salix viminalis TaxID=40686 RepID=A0A6N2N4L1_SALVM
MDAVMSRQIVGLMIGIIPPFRKVLIGDSAPLHAIEDSADMARSEGGHSNYDFDIESKSSEGVGVYRSIYAKDGLVDLPAGLESPW